MNADGALSFLIVTNCASDDQARDTAIRMWNGGYAAYEIWRENVCVDEGKCLARSESG
jgi:hypothetical protein